VPGDLGAQRFRALAEKRAHDDWDDDQVEENSRRSLDASGVECVHRTEGFAVRHFGEQPRERLQAALTRHLAHERREFGETPRFGDGRAEQTHVVGIQRSVQNSQSYGPQTHLERRSRGWGLHVPHGPGDVAHDHRREQLLLAGVPGADRRLARAGDFGDLLDARALEAAIEEHLLRRIEYPLVDLPGDLARRTAGPRAQACGKAFAGRGGGRVRHRLHLPGSAGGPIGPTQLALRSSRVKRETEHCRSVPVHVPEQARSRNKQPTPNLSLRAQRSKSSSQ
jgi:hypothetical protein